MKARTPKLADKKRRGVKQQHATKDMMRTYLKLSVNSPQTPKVITS